MTWRSSDRGMSLSRRTHVGLLTNPSVCRTRCATIARTSTSSPAEGNMGDYTDALAKDLKRIEGEMKQINAALAEEPERRCRRQEG